MKSKAIRISNDGRCFEFNRGDYELANRLETTSKRCDWVKLSMLYVRELETNAGRRNARIKSGVYTHEGLHDNAVLRCRRPSDFRCFFFLIFLSATCAHVRASEYHTVEADHTRISRKATYETLVLTAVRGTVLGGSR